MRVSPKRSAGPSTAYAYPVGRRLGSMAIASLLFGVLLLGPAGSPQDALAARPEESGQRVAADLADSVSAAPSDSADAASSSGSVTEVVDTAYAGSLPYHETFDNLVGWTINPNGPLTPNGETGTVQLLSTGLTRQGSPASILPPQGTGSMAMLCTDNATLAQGPGGNLDNDPDLRNDNDRAHLRSPQFTLTASQVPATLSFDWNFLTGEWDGSGFQSVPFDDFFEVRLNGGVILSGSVPGAGRSPYPDVPVDGIEAYLQNEYCDFEYGQSGWGTFQMLLTQPDTYTLDFIVADQADFAIDSGLLVDNLRIEPEVDLAITKTASPSPAIAGDPLFYEITVVNNGSGRANAVVVDDTLPAAVRFVSADAPPTDDGMGGPIVNPACSVAVAGPPQQIHCELGTLGGGESTTFHIQVEIDEMAVANGLETLTNVAVVDSFNVDSFEADNATEQVSFLDDLADLSVVKVSKPDDQVRAGEVFTYTVIVENAGPSAARAVALDDTLLSNGNFTLLSILDDPARASDSCAVVTATPPQSGRVIRCQLNEPLETLGSPNGTGRWTLQMEATAAQTQDIDNEVRVYTIDNPAAPSPGTPDPDLSNNTARDAISILDTSNLSLTKTSVGLVHDPLDCATVTPIADRVTAGDRLTWTLRVVNQIPGAVGVPGGSTADNVVIEDFVPAGVEIISVTSSAGACNAGTPGLVGAPARCNVGTLLPGAGATMTVVALVDPDYVGDSDSNLLQNGARAFSDNIDPDLSDNLALRTSRVDEVADLRIRKGDSPDPVIAGEGLSWELIITNAGPSTARNVIVRDQLPPEVVFRSARIEQMAGRETCTYSEGAHEVICSLLEVPPGEPPVGQRRIIINALVRPSTMVASITNTARVLSEQTPDCNPLNNTATATTAVGTRADLAIDKTSEPVKVFAGEQKLYHIDVRNLGPSVAKDVTVYDVLPDEVEYEIDTNSPMCTQPAELIGWRAWIGGAGEVPAVATSAMGLATFVLNTSTNRLTYAIQLADIDNVVSAHIHRGVAGVNGPVVVTLYNGALPAPSATEPLQGEIVLTPALAAEIAANPAGFYVNVHSTDFPAGEVRGQLARTRNAPLLCPIGVLPPVAPGYGRDGVDPNDPGIHRFDIWARVRPETLSGTTITNVAMVTSQTTLGDPDTTNNVDSSKNLVLSKADIKVAAFGKNDGQVRAGELLTYTLMVDNLGPSYAEGVALKNLIQSAGVFDLVDIASDRPARCRTLPARGDQPPGGIDLPATAWPVTAAPPAFGVLDPTGIEDIDQRLEIDCELTEILSPELTDDRSQLAVLAATGPQNPGRWILTVRVRAANAQDIDSIVDVLTSSEEPNLANNHAVVEHEITDVSDLVITKVATGEVQVAGQPGRIFDLGAAGQPFPAAPNYATSPSRATAGRRIAYRLTVRNDGPSHAENVRVFDRLPAGVTLYPGSLVVSNGGQCATGTPGTILDRIDCGLGYMPLGDVQTIDFQVLVDPSLPAGAVLENDAVVTSDIFDPDNSDNQAYAQTVVDNWADMSATKLGFGQNVTGYDPVQLRFIRQDLPAEVTAGLILRYQVQVQNNGPGDARNVVVRDRLPTAPLPGPVTFLYADGADCRPDEVDGGTIYCEVGDMALGSRQTFDLYVLVDPSVPEGSVLTNCVDVLFGPSTPPGQPGPLPGDPPILPVTQDPFPLDNTKICTNVLVHAVADVGGPGGAGLDYLSKRDVPAEPRLDTPFEPDRAIAGREHRYRIDFGNAGPSTAVGVGLIDRMDFKQPALRGETFVRCEPLDPDDLVTCRYDAVSNTVTVERFLAHNEPIIPSAGTGTLPVGIGYGFYLVTLVDPGYVLDASNAMPTAENSEPGLIARNTARISTSTTDFRTANDVDTERTRIIAEADLSIEKTDIFGDPLTDPGNYFLFCDPVTPGGMINYTIVVTNDGPSDAADVYVVDWLPAGVVHDPAQVMIDVDGGAGEVIEIRDDGRLTIRVGRDLNNAGVAELGRVNAGNRVTINVAVMVRQDAVCGSQLVNRARVETRRNDIAWPPAVTGPPEGGAGVSPTTPRTPTIDPDPTNNDTSESTTIECPSIEVNKTVSFDGQCPGRDVTLINLTGQPVTFCYEITNTGTTYLDDILVTDTLKTRTTMPTVIFSDTIRFGRDPKVPVAPGETVLRQVTVDHLTKECGVATDTVEVSANPVNSGRTDLPCLPIVGDSDSAEIEIPCAGVDFRIQLPIIDNGDCETWIQVQNVGDEPTVPLLVTWGESGFCPPQAAGPLKSECAGLLRPGSAWSFAESQIPAGSHSAVLYSLSVDLIEIAPNTKVPFASLVCDAVFFNVVGDYLDWVRFDTAYRNRGVFAGFDFGEHAGEPLAAIVNRSCPDPSNPAARVNAAYSGISSDQEGAADPTFGGYAYYAPLIFADSAGLSTTLRIQNSGILCTSLEIWFKGQDNCLRPILGDVLALAPGETVDFDVNTVVGPDWLGSAWIRATQPMGIIVDTLGPNHFTSYTATPADVYELGFTLGNQVNFAPLIYSEYQGWDTAIQVQNLSGTTNAKVKVYFLDKSGDIITTLVDWICPRGSQTYFLPAIAAMPGNWVGSARVESQSWWAPGTNEIDPPKISSVVLLEKWSDPARSIRREAVAYNGQTECLLYDWQVGGGKGGTASGSAVFAVPFLAKGNRGYTSEVAITNLVAKPGFTDFAIFVYDQNGLLDQVCEKLHDRQVEYIDLNTWGGIPPRFLGSMVVSAVFWEHEVFDPRGNFVRNLVGLGGVSVERVGTTQGSQDLPGDESKATEAFPVFDHFHSEDALPCPGVPAFRPLSADR
ncbi:MAG: DUF11 domain-containing protein [Chloroflexi bacterium]|nr:DUF11 domain-containing protein [Chloroflexota bacterium]